MLRAGTVWGGIGGGLLGLYQAGYNPVFTWDDRKFCCYDHRKKFWDHLHSPIEHASALMQSYADGDTCFEALPDVDVWIASPPCKRFSSLSVRDKERFTFNPREIEIARLFTAIATKQPRVFIVENVEALSRFFYFEEDQLWCHHQGGPIPCAQLPYHLLSLTLNSKNFGVPQSRKRLYLIGIHKQHFPSTMGRAFFEHAGLSEDKQYVAYIPTVRDAFSELEGIPNQECSLHTPVRIERFNALRPGDSYYGTQNNKRIYQDQPSPTITSHRTQYVHPVEPRTLTVRECARLMGFPDTAVFFGPRTAQLDQVGCGITPPVACFIGQWVKDFIR